MEIYKAIGERIAKKRAEKGLSQEELASRVNSSQGLIAKIETGNRKIQVDLLFQIVDVLDTDCDYLLRGISTKHLSAAELTGFDNKTLGTLAEWKKTKQHPLRPFLMGECDYLGILERLICTDAGNELLSRLEEYLDVDGSSSTFHIENKDGEEVPYEKPIIIKNSTSVGNYYICPEIIERIALDAVLDAVKSIKEGSGK